MNKHLELTFRCMFSGPVNDNNERDFAFSATNNGQHPFTLYRLASNIQFKLDARTSLKKWIQLLHHLIYEFIYLKHISNQPKIFIISHTSDTTPTRDNKMIGSALRLSPSRLASSCRFSLIFPRPWQYRQGIGPGIPSHKTDLSPPQYPHLTISRFPPCPSSRGAFDYSLLPFLRFGW